MREFATLWRIGSASPQEGKSDCSPVAFGRWPDRLPSLWPVSPFSRLRKFEERNAELAKKMGEKGLMFEGTNLWFEPVRRPKVDRVDCMYIHTYIHMSHGSKDEGRTKGTKYEVRRTKQSPKYEVRRSKYEVRSSDEIKFEAQSTKYEVRRSKVRSSKLKFDAKSTKGEGRSTKYEARTK